MRLLWLKLRYAMGWWRDPAELERMGKRFLFIARMLVLFAAIVVFGRYVTLQIHRAITPSGATLMGILSSGMLPFALAAIVSLFGVYYRQFARRASTSGMATLQGRCFSVRFDQPVRLFARIGVAQEHAHWYALPIIWEDAVAPSGAMLELDTIAGNAYVQRLRRFDAGSSELSRDDEPEATAASDGSQTQEQSRVLHPYFRRFWLGWGLPPQDLFISGVCLLLLYVIFSILSPGLFASLPLLNPSETWVDVLRGELFYLPLNLIGWALFAWSILFFRVWWRAKRTLGTGQVAIEGTVTLAHKQQALFHQNVYIILQPEHGPAKVLLVPGRLSYRVRRGTSLRIEYQPPNEYVTNVTRI